MSEKVPRRTLAVACEVSFRELRARENSWESIAVPGAGGPAAGRGDGIFPVSRGGGGR